MEVDTSKALEQINTAFDKWLEQYHHSRHRSLKCSPLQKRFTGPSVCQVEPEVADIETLFMMERRCRVYKDGTIRLFDQVFEILDPPITCNRLTVYYTPWELSCVYYGRFYKPAFKLNLTQNAHRFDHP